MCGLVGVYSLKEQGKIARNAINILKRLEYRGYDSAGILALRYDSPYIESAKVVGKVEDLEKKFESKLDNDYKMVLAHNRWATHGKPTESNCHPHISMGGYVKLVHNGIIENAAELRAKLLAKGYKFYGETDSEVLANYLDDCLLNGSEGTPSDVFSSVANALSNVAGTYALAIIIDHPDYNIMLGFHRGSPLVVGVNSTEAYICSDLNALKGYTQEGLPLDAGCNIMIADGEITYSQQPTKFIQLESEGDYELDGYESFTQKEILSQNETLNQTLSGRVEDGEVRISALDENVKFLKKLKKVTIVAEGTSYHAGLVGKEIIERLTEVDVAVELASEYSCKTRPVRDDEMVILISQSGETADVVKCARECKARDMTTMAITNGVESQLSRMVDFGIYLRCGVEIGVASTKAFTSTVLVLYLFACKLARFDRMTQDEVRNIFGSGFPSADAIKDAEKGICSVIDKIEKRLPLEKIKSFIFLGKCEYKAIAMEAALKMNELSYIPSLAYSLGSLKHGPLGLIDKDIVVVLLDTELKYKSDIEICIAQLKSRDTEVIHEFHRLNDTGSSPSLSNMIYTSIQCQLLAYHVAKRLGRDIDKPRHLAKSVTVK